ARRHPDPVRHRPGRPEGRGGAAPPRLRRAPPARPPPPGPRGARPDPPRLPAPRLAREAPGQTLQPTALVHEAYLRLVGDQKFESRGHFFAAAAEAMRRVLIEAARRKQSPKHGGGRRRLDLDEAHRVLESADDLLLL